MSDLLRRAVEALREHQHRCECYAIEREFFTCQHCRDAAIIADFDALPPVAALGVEGGWQTMETAPDNGKPDGPRFLALLESGRVTICHRVNQYECADGTRWPRCAPFWGEDAYSYAGAFHMIHPIGWMPLPRAAAPTQDAIK